MVFLLFVFYRPLFRFRGSVTIFSFIFYYLLYCKMHNLNPRRTKVLSSLVEKVGIFHFSLRCFHSAMSRIRHDGISRPRSCRRSLPRGESGTRYTSAARAAAVYCVPDSVLRPRARDLWSSIRRSLRYLPLFKTPPRIGNGTSRRSCRISRSSISHGSGTRTANTSVFSGIWIPLAASGSGDGETILFEPSPWALSSTIHR